MRIPVPWVYTLTYLAGPAIQHFVPLRISSEQISRVYFIAGFLLIALGILLAISAQWIFRSRRTTTVPLKSASTLVTWGPYRFTRNPMYLGLFLIYVGVAGTQSQLWPIVLLPVLFLYVDRVVIPFEEARLTEVFGDSYRKLLATVRRWI